jgi:hypothetical protein
MKIMYENGAMRPVETILRRGEGRRIKENNERSEFN